MSMNEKIKIRLQGHEKFALRDGWLNKGIRMVEKDSSVFLGKNAPDVFGIGNNMVKSLRYWLKAFGLIEEKPGKGAFLTDMGNLILENDPYFEDVFTIWILHSYIARNIDNATSWYMFFNRIAIDDLDKEQIEKLLLKEISKYAIGTSFSEKSVKSDLDVILNMYGKKKENSDPEDKSQSPFAQLNLLKCFDGKFSKNHPDTKIINEWVVLFELSHMLANKDFISIEDAVEGECGLSKVYQLSSVTANELLDRLESFEYIDINRTAGLDVIYKREALTSDNIVKAYYRNRG